MSNNITQTLDKILNAFESGEIPKAVAIASFPISDIPSANWSFFNRTIQSLNGTADARGYRQWLLVKRNVKKGAKAIHILSPCLKKNNAKYQDNDNSKSSEDNQVKHITFFKETPVFRVEDTEGEPIKYENIELPEFPLIERAKEWGINVKAVSGNNRYYGYYSPDLKEIAMATPSEKTFFHELSHVADHIIKGRLNTWQDPFQEITAELSAQALARIVGKSIQDTIGNSYRYIKSYAEKLNISAYKACLTVLSDTEKILNLILHGNINDGYKKNESISSEYQHTNQHQQAA